MQTICFLKVNESFYSVHFLDLINDYFNVDTNYYYESILQIYINVFHDRCTYVTSTCNTVETSKISYNV